MAVLFFLRVSVFAVVVISTPMAWAEKFQCWGDWFQQGSTANGHVDLKPAAYDKQFLQADLLNFSLGVDTYNLKNKAVTVVLLDKTTHRSVTSTTGLRPIANSNVQTTESIWLEPLADGSKLQISVDCSLDPN